MDAYSFTTYASGSLGVAGSVTGIGGSMFLGLAAS